MTTWRWHAGMSAAMSFLTPPKLRHRALRMLGVDLPATSYVGAGTFIGSARVRFGEHVGVNVQCFLDGAADLVIEDYVRIGFRTSVITGTHPIEPGVIRRDLAKPTVEGPVRIGRGTWIGAGVTVLPGVTIGEGCVVAAGAIVTRDCAPNGLYAGVPARLERELAVERAA